MTGIAMRLLLRGLGIAFLLMLLGCATLEPGALVDRDGWRVQRELLAHPQDKNKKIELFWTRPAVGGPHPALLFIHGHQADLRNGGAAYVRSGRLGAMARRGY